MRLSSIRTIWGKRFSAAPALALRGQTPILSFKAFCAEPFRARKE